MENLKVYLFIGTLLVCMFALGYCSHEVYNIVTHQRLYDGLWIPNSSEQLNNQITAQYDKNGNWICVNINGMDWKDAVATCEHETGHEMFARFCETDINKCMDNLK